MTYADALHAHKAAVIQYVMNPQPILYQRCKETREAWAILDREENANRLKSDRLQ